MRVCGLSLCRPLTPYAGFFRLQAIKNHIFIAFPLKNPQVIEIHKRYSNILKKANIDFKEKGIYIRFNAESEDFFSENINVFESIIKSLSAGSFDIACCSRYVECSDKKQCIQPNVDIANSCYYRINLENGKIFYGKNTILHKE